MNRFNSVLSVTGLVLAIGASMAAGDAQAVTQSRQSTGGPTDICQSALPIFDGNIRKRPLALQNEGTSNAFVTCSFPSGEGRGFGSSGLVTVVWLYAQSNDGNPHVLNCTGVSGNPGGPNEFIAKSLSLAASGASVPIQWFAADFAGAPTTFPGNGSFSASCNLDPGVGLNEYFVNSNTDVGL